MKIITKSIEIAESLNTYKSKQFRHFAFLYLRNKLLAIGQNNLTTTDPKAIRFGGDYPFIHAEIDAIAKLWGRTFVGPKLRMVSIRLDPKNRMLISKPCKSCMSTIVGLSLPVYYYDGKNYDRNL